MNDHIAKPFQVAELVTKVTRWTEYLIDPDQPSVISPRAQG